MKEERLAQPKASKGRIVIIVVAILIVVVTLFTVNVLGDDQDGVDHLIKYTNDEIWALTYKTLGVQPLSAKGEANLMNLATTLPLGSSSDVVKTGTEELDRWINEQVEGSYLLDRIRLEDGCEALLVMNPETNEASFISLNRTEDFHTFEIDIVKPEPLSAEVRVYEVTLGLSGDQETASGPLGQGEEAPDRSSQLISPPSVKEEKALESGQRGHSGEKVDEGLSPSTESDNKVSLSDFADLLSVSSEEESSLDTLLGTVSQEAAAARASDFEEEADVAKAPVAKAAVKEAAGPPAEETADKAVAALDKGEDKESLPEKKKTEEIETSKESFTESPAEEENLTKKEEKAPPLSTTPPIEEDLSPERPDKEPDRSLDEELDRSPNESGGPAFKEFHSLELDQPKDGILLTVPAQGVGIVKIKIGERLEPIGDVAFQVGDGDEFRLYNKDASHSTPYITWSKENYIVKYKIEEKTRLILEGGGVGSGTLTLYNGADISLGQIIANTDSLTIKRAATVPKGGGLKINAIGVANDTYKNGVSGPKSLHVDNNVTLSALSEAVGGSGLFAEQNITLKPGALVDGVGETFGVALGAAGETLSIDNASLTGKTQPSRNNKEGTLWAGVYAPTGTIKTVGVFNLVGDATQATPVMPTPQDDPTVPRTIDEILAQTKSFGLYAAGLNTGRFPTAPAFSNIACKGGDVGAFFSGDIVLEVPVNGQFTGNWVGLISRIGISQISTAGGTITIEGDGVDAQGLPFGYGFYHENISFIMRVYTTMFPTMSERYKENGGSRLVVYGSQVGVYADSVRFELLDGSHLVIRGGVDKNYSSDTPPPLVENTFGVYGTSYAGAYSRYNSDMKIYSGYRGIQGKDLITSVIRCTNSSKLLVVASDTAIRTKKISLHVTYGSHLRAIGEYGGIDSSLANGDLGGGGNYANFVIGKKDTYGPGQYTISILEAIATNTAQLSGSVGVIGPGGARIHGDAYLLGVGDITGAYLGEVIFEQGSADRGVRIVGVANPYLSYKNKPVRNRIPGTYPAAFAHTGSMTPATQTPNYEIIEVYEGSQGDFIFSGGNGFRNFYNKGLTGLNLFLTSSRFSVTNYNWSTLTYDWTKEDLINNVSYPSAVVNNMGNHGLQAAQYPHNEADFELVRTVQLGDGISVDKESAISVRPQFESPAATFIADNMGEPINVAKYEWGDNYRPRPDKEINIPHVRHRIVFKDVPVYNQQKVSMSYGSLRLRNGVEESIGLNYKITDVDIAFLPVGGGPNDKEYFTIDDTNRVSASRGDFTIHNLRLGDYWLTDKTRPTNPFGQTEFPPPTIHFRIKMEEANDGNPIPYRYPVIEMLDGGDVGAEPKTKISATQSLRPVHLRYNLEDTVYRTDDIAFDMEPTWEAVNLDVYYGKGYTEVTTSIIDPDDGYLIGGKLHIEEYWSTDLTTLLSSKTIDIVKDPQGDENKFIAGEDKVYIIWAETSEGDKIYPHSKQMGLSRTKSGLVSSSLVPTDQKHHIDNVADGKTANLKIYLTLPLHRVPLDTVELFENNTIGTTSLAGASYKVSGVRSDISKTITPVTYTSGDGKLDVTGLKPLYVYTLEQTAPPSGYIQRLEKYQFEIKIPEKGDGTMDYANWELQPIAPVQDGWVGTQTNEMVIGNAKVPFMDYKVLVQAHGLWRAHGEENFFIQLTQQGVATPKVYYRMATFTGGATKESQIVNCPSFGGANTGEDRSQCPSTEVVRVVFNDIKPGNYTLSLLPSERFAPQGDSVNKGVSISLTQDQGELFANGQGEGFFTAGAHQAYEFKLTP